MIFADLTKSDITERQWELLNQSGINLETVSSRNPGDDVFEDIDGVLVDTPQDALNFYEVGFQVAIFVDDTLQLWSL